MPQTQSEGKAGGLEALARAHFPRERGFTAAEWTLLAKTAKGQVAVCGPRSDPKDSAGWGREREIGADLIRWLCTDHKAKEQVDPWGVSIQAAKITGTLNLDSIVVPFPIRLWQCALSMNALLGHVEIPQLDLAGTWSKSVEADGAIVKGDVYLRYGFHADGKVDLLGAQIGGDLDCEGGTFNNPEGYAIDADEIQVKDNVFLGENFTAQGEVNLLGAQIGGDLDCRGTFNNPNGDALSVERATVKGDISLGKGFIAQGSVTLLGAHIEGTLDCSSPTFKTAALDLRDTATSLIQDDAEHWPQPGKLLLDGFVYGRIDDGPKDYKTRLDWLALQPQKPFATQPYLQLAKVLREAGDDDGAVSVLEEMERRRRQQTDLNRPDRQALSWFFRELAGYGYDPGRSVWAILALSGLGWILYRRSYLMGGMVPTKNDESGGSKADTFAPLAYSVENSLPLVKLGQADKWQPNPDHDSSPPRNGKWIQGAARAKPWPRWLRWLERLLVFVGLLAPVDLKERPSRFSRLGTSPRFLRWFLWFQILLGWVLATLFVAGVTGIIRKD
jgi:hypothetical protein